MPERWDALDRVWHAVLERPEPERAAAIDELCAEDHLRVSCEHHRGATLHPH